MTEFEKWYKQYCKENNLYSVEHIEISRDVWKAALEWVLSIDSGFCSCGCLNDSYENESVLAQIKGELKE